MKGKKMFAPGEKVVRFFGGSRESKDPAIGEICTIRSCNTSGDVEIVGYEGVYLDTYFARLSSLQGKFVRVKNEEAGGWDPTKWETRIFHSISHGLVLCQHPTKQDELEAWKLIRRAPQ